MGLEAETLAAHNGYRAMHGAPPLSWSAECAFSAQVLKLAHALALISTRTDSLLSLALYSY